MLQDRLKELDALIEQNPVSPQALALAADIKRQYATTEDIKAVEEFVAARLPKLSGEINDLYEGVIRQQLSEISAMINLSYIARHYFNKSRAWISQRVNGNTVNGKACRFTPAELDTFNNALRDMAARLSNVTIGY